MTRETAEDAAHLLSSDRSGSSVKTFFDRIIREMENKANINTLVSSDFGFFVRKVLKCSVSFLDKCAADLGAIIYSRYID